jgi:hypothetical protein
MTRISTLSVPLTHQFLLQLFVTESSARFLAPYTLEAPLPNMQQVITLLLDINCFPCAMELPPAWSQTCICRCIFSVQQAYTFHRRTCSKMKKWFSSALVKAKEVWHAKKRQKMEKHTCDPTQFPSDKHAASELELVSQETPCLVHPEVSFGFIKDFLAHSKGLCFH